LRAALRTRKWQDKQGTERYSTEIVGNEMQMLAVVAVGAAWVGPGGGASGSGASGGGSGQGAGGGSGGWPWRDPFPEYSHSGESAGGGKDDFDDDIPF